MVSGWTMTVQVVIPARSWRVGMVTAVGSTAVTSMVAGVVVIGIASLSTNEQLHCSTDGRLGATHTQEPSLTAKKPAPFGICVAWNMGATVMLLRRTGITGCARENCELRGSRLSRIPS